MKKIILSAAFALITFCASAAFGDIFSEMYLNYLVMDDDASTDYPKVWVIGPSTAGSTQPNLSLSIPTAVTHDGVTYRVTQIDAKAFSGKTNIVQAFIGYGITHIGNEAFKGCSKLVNVRIPSSIQSIGDNAFASCSALKEVNIANDDPSTFTTSASAFPSNSDMTLGVAKTNDLRTVTAFNNLSQYSKFATIELSSAAYDFTTDDSFAMCVTKAPSKGVPGEVKLVGVFGNSTGAFAPKATYTHSVYSYKLVATGFRSCKDQTQIKSFDFSNATNLKTIDCYTFSGCTNLTSVNLGSTVDQIELYAFENVPISSITIPKSVSYIGYLAFNKCPNLSAISVDSNNPFYKSSYGVLYMYLKGDKWDLVCCPAAFPYTAFYEYMFPSQVTVIDCNAFAFCTNLKTIHIPYGVQKLKDYLFNAALQEVKIPGSVSEFDADAFGNASGLQRIFINITTPPTITIFPATPANLYVPYGFVSNYKSAAFWKNCVNI